MKKSFLTLVRSALVAGLIVAAPSNSSARPRHHNKQNKQKHSSPCKKLSSSTQTTQLSETENIVCYICQDAEDYSNLIDPCGYKHQVHLKCLQTMTQTLPKECGLCRRSMNISIPTFLDSNNPAALSQAMAQAGMGQPAQTMWQKTKTFLRNNSGKIAATAITCGIVGLLYYSKMGDKLNDYQDYTLRNYTLEQLEYQEQNSVYLADNASHEYWKILYNLNETEKQSLSPFRYIKDYGKKSTEKYSLQYAKDIIQAAYDLCSQCKLRNNPNVFNIHPESWQSSIDRITPEGLKFLFGKISQASRDFLKPKY